MDYTGKIRWSITRKIRMLKSLGVLCLIPFLVNDIIIPGMICIIYMHYGKDDHTFYSILYYVQIFSPFFSTFWIYLHMVKYIDVKGNELFYISDRIKVGEILSLYILYSVISVIPFLWYINMYPVLAGELLHMVIVYFFLAALSYFMCYLLRSVAIAIFPTLCYTFFAMAQSKGKVPIWSYYEPDGLRLETEVSKYIAFLLIGILLFVAGYFLNKKYTDYR